MDHPVGFVQTSASTSMAACRRALPRSVHKEIHNEQELHNYNRHNWRRCWQCTIFDTLNPPKTDLNVITSSMVFTLSTTSNIRAISSQNNLAGEAKKTLPTQLNPDNMPALWQLYTHSRTPASKKLMKFPTLKTTRLHKRSKQTPKVWRMSQA